MKILNKTETWSGKVNFVDENEVYLGYDTADDCCAHGGWFVSDKADFWPADIYAEKEPKDAAKIMDLPGWTFDTSYFKDIPNGEGGAAQFRIVGPDGAEKFITLFNCHNGYYGKGFEFVVPKDTAKNREATL